MRRSRFFWFSLIGMLLCIVCALGAAAAAPVAQQSPSNPYQQLVFDTRADLELLADKVLTSLDGFSLDVVRSLGA